MEPLWRKAGSIPPSPGEDRGSAGITEGMGFTSIFREVYEYTLTLQADFHPPLTLAHWVELERGAQQEAGRAS